MSKQASITKFFALSPTSASKTQKSSRTATTDATKSPTKSDHSDGRENLSPNVDMSSEKDDVSSAKKARIDSESERSESPSCSMTPDQKQRALENKIRAKCKQFEGALHPNIGPTWFVALEDEFKKDYFQKLSSFLSGQRTTYPTSIYPPANQVWSWTHYFDLKDTKVVILGQDPYHGPGQAHGLCFSVQKGVPPPPSLLNMYKALAQDKDIEGFITPRHGFLEGWAKQGVLMLNACLTVRKGEANSHKDQGWERITDAVIKKISDRCHGVVFLLWGSYAQKKASVVDSKKHHLLKAVHPSPLSAHRGFFEAKHFSLCNKLLKNDGKEPIDWSKFD